MQVGLSKRMIDSHFMPVTHFDQKNRQTQATFSTPSFFILLCLVFVDFVFCGIDKTIGKTY